MLVQELSLSNKHVCICLWRQLRSIDRLLEKLRASVDQADKPFGSSMHTRNLRDRIRDLVQERQEICFEARQL